MKKVAIFSDGWRKYFNYAWVDGCHQYIWEHELDTNLYVFNSFGNFSLDDKFNAGEYNIYNLPDLKDFDGAIIDLTNVRQEEVRKNLIQRLQKANIPTVSLVDEIEGFYTAGIDNYTAMYHMVEHVIQKHGCKVINFVGGPIKNGENLQRLAAYKDALEKNGIAYDEKRVFCKNYQIQTGEDALEHFIGENLMPEAFVCANDNIAVGVCHIAKQRGYSVPKDFLVTGYDNFDKASYFEPRITTAGFVREEIAYKAMEVLHRVWNGETKISPAYADVTYVFQDSCGCKAENPKDRGKYIEKHILEEDRDMRMDHDMMRLKRELLECKSFQEMGRCLPKHMERLKCEAIYMLLNPEIARCEDYSHVAATVEEEQRMKGYPDNLEVIMAYENGTVLSNPMLHSKSLIPAEENVQNAVYVFSPLHFREQEVGYLVFKNCDYMLDSQLIFEILTVLLESMENMYHRLLLSHLNEELSTLYVMDSLTGLYNRMAYNRFAVPMLNDSMKKNKPLMIMFVDVDRLKYINDNLGHDMGNIAIKTVAMAAATMVPEGGIVIRYGGDEFVVMAPDVEEKQADEIVANIEKHVAKMSESMNMGFEITASLGYVIAREPDIDLGEYINRADEKMYETKRKHHEMQKKMQP